MSRRSSTGGRGLGADAATVTSSSPSPSTRPRHSRQWTHTAIDGAVHTRIHRKEMMEQANKALAEEEEQEEQEKQEERVDGENQEEEKEEKQIDEDQQQLETIPADPQDPSSQKSVPQADEEPDEPSGEIYMSDDIPQVDASSQTAAASAFATAYPSVSVGVSESAAVALAAPAVDTTSTSPAATSSSPSLVYLLSLLRSYAPPSAASIPQMSQQQQQHQPPAPKHHPPFELFTQLIDVIRGRIRGGDSVMGDEEKKELMGSVNGDESSSGATGATPPSSLRALLHSTRIHFASCYPLTPSLWLQWTEDVQTFGSGCNQFDEDLNTQQQLSSEEREAREEAAAASDQQLLLSLYQLALADYASSDVWSSFLSYVSLTCTRLLSTSAARASWNALIESALLPRGVAQERRRRARERKNARREARRKRREEAAEEKKADEMEESDSSDSDEDDDDLLPDEGEMEDTSATPTAEAVSSNPFTLHASILPLVPSAYAHAASSSSAVNGTFSLAPSFTHPCLLPAPIPLAYSPLDGYQTIFQQLRGIEMKYLQHLMQRLQTQQQKAAAGDEDDGGDDSGEQVDEATIMSSMDRISRLYRIELTIPLKDLPAVYASFLDWQMKQGGSSAEEAQDPDLLESYNAAMKLAQTLENRFEMPWRSMEQQGMLCSGVGTLTPEADLLLSQYIAFLTQSSQAKQRCKRNPAFLMCVLERIVSNAFLQPEWWMRFIQLAEVYASGGGGGHVSNNDHASTSSSVVNESSLYIMEICLRTIRNCPWVPELAIKFLHALETAHLGAGSIVTHEAVRYCVDNILANPALQSNTLGMIEVMMAVVDMYRRILLQPATIHALTASSSSNSPSYPTITAADASFIRSYFLAAQRYMPYLPAFGLSAGRISEMASEVYMRWVEIERNFLFRFSMDTGEEEEDVEKEVAMRNAREVFRQYVDEGDRGSVDARPWLDWAEFEARALLLAPVNSSSSEIVQHVTSIYRQGVDRMTSHVDFTLTSAASLRALEPLLNGWLRFEGLHAPTLHQLQQAERRCQKYMDALAAISAQEQQQAAAIAQQQQQQQPGWAAQQSEEEEAEQPAATWLTKATRPKQAQKQGKKGRQEKKGADKGKQKEGKKAEAAAANQPAAPNAKRDPATTGKKRRRSDAASSAADATAATTQSSAAETGPAAKKERKHPPAAAAASSPSKPTAADTPVAMDTSSADSAAASAPSIPSSLISPPPHALFVTNLSWTLRPAELHAMFASYGEVVHLQSHKATPHAAMASATATGKDKKLGKQQQQQTSAIPSGPIITKPFVEVRYRDEAACEAVIAKLHGTVLQGKKIKVSRSPLIQELAKKAESASSPTSATSTSTSAPPTTSGANDADPLSVFVKNLPRGHDNDLPEIVRKYFEQCGQVTSVEIGRQPHPPTSNKKNKGPTSAVSSGSNDASQPLPPFKSFGIVRFASPDSTQAAFKLHLQPFEGNILQVVPNDAPSRMKKQQMMEKQKMEEKKKAEAIKRAFVPRSALVQRARKQPTRPATATTTSTSSSANDTPLPAPARSNEDFRAMLLGKRSA